VEQVIRLSAAALVLVAFAAAPTAAADPQDLEPGCGEGQMADPGACTPEPVDIEPGNDLFGSPDLIPGAFPGANPNLPPGPTPKNFPVVVPLGVTPFNVPSNLPLGPTPPSGFPFPGA
jgi:hypothetical protein